MKTPTTKIQTILKSVFAIGVLACVFYFNMNFFISKNVNSSGLTVNAMSAKADDPEEAGTKYIKIEWETDKKTNCQGCKCKSTSKLHTSCTSGGNEDCTAGIVNWSFEFTNPVDSCKKG